MANARRIIASGLTAAVLAAGLIAGTAGAANAATPINPSTINNVQPAAMGCRADQKTIYHAVITGAGGKALGYVDLMASTHCHSVWAHVHGTKSGQLEAQVIHNGVGMNTAVGINSATDAFTYMSWDKGLSAYAWGGIKSGGKLHTARTASY